MADSFGAPIGAIGAYTLAAIRRLGKAALFLGQVLRHSGTSVLRPSLTVREIYFAGALSLIIIMVSGLYIGWSQTRVVK